MVTKEQIAARIESLEREHKAVKTQVEVYKLSNNASYGKFGSQYSPLFSPQLLTQVTLTGQLALLLLIERLEAAGAKVVSANTDGVTVLHREHIDPQINGWQAETGFGLERVDYQAVYSRDVNNYVAIKTDGSVKGKGIFTTPGLMKNPQKPIITRAVMSCLADGVPITDTVTGCEDLTEFLTVRTVRGGAVWRWDEVGKVVRWYRGVTGEPIYYLNGNLVPSSDNAAVVQDLPDRIPDDLDHQWYINEAKELLEVVGA